MTVVAPQPANRCAICGMAHPPTATVCPSCGSPLDVSLSGDPLANTVAGAPVSATPSDLGQNLATARERLLDRAPEAAAVVAAAMNRLAGLSPDASHITRTDGPRGLRRPAPPPPPPPVPLSARVVWFVFVGSWLTCLWVVAAWLVLCTMIGRPQAERMLALAPSVLTLRPTTDVAAPLLPLARASQLPYTTGAHAAYFLIVGWWASLIWLILAYAISLTAVGIPVAYRMFAAAPAVAQLRRGP